MVSPPPTRFYFCLLPRDFTLTPLLTLSPAQPQLLPLAMLAVGTEVPMWNLPTLLGPPVSPCWPSPLWLRQEKPLLIFT